MPNRRLWLPRRERHLRAPGAAATVNQNFLLYISRSSCPIAPVFLLSHASVIQHLNIFIESNSALEPFLCRVSSHSQHLPKFSSLSIPQIAKHSSERHGVSGFQFFLLHRVILLGDRSASEGSANHTIPFLSTTLACPIIDQRCYASALNHHH